MNVVIKVNQVKEIIQMRDRRGDSFLNAHECGDIIDLMCLILHIKITDQFHLCHN